MKLAKLFSASIIMSTLLFSPFSTAQAETVRKGIQPQVGTTNVNELMSKTGTFYYEKFIAGTETPCQNNVHTCTYPRVPEKNSHNLKVNVKGQTGDVSKREVLIKHLGEDILTNQTSDKPEIRNTHSYSYTKTKSTTTTIKKGFSLPDDIANVIVGADIIGMGKINLPFDINKSESITESESETLSTSPQPYTVKPKQVIKVVTELYVLEFGGTVNFTAEPVSNDIKIELEAQASNCRGVPGGVICAYADKRDFTKDFTVIYDNLDDTHKQELENSGMYMNTKVPGEKKIPFFKGEGSFEGVGGHRVVTKDYDITDPNNPKLVNVRSQDI